MEEYQTQFGDERDAVLKLYNFGSGAQCVLYIPDDVNSNTKIMVYYPGQNEQANWYTKEGGMYVQNYLEQIGNDAIVIMADVNNSNNIERTELAIEVVREVQDIYDLNSSDIMYSGWSLGAESCLLTAKSYIEQNPNADPQICITVDGYGNYGYNPKIMISQIKDQFIENGTILIGLEPTWRVNYPLEEYARAGINVLRVIYKGDSNLDMVNNGDYFIKENSGGYHTVVNQHFFKDRFSGFISGKIPLPTEYYVYQCYNIESGEWVTIDPFLIDTYEKLNSYFGNDIFLINLKRISSLQNLNIAEIVSDKQILLNCVNKIISNIRNSNFVQNGMDYTMSFESTTKIPSSISEILKSFYTVNSILLFKIANEVQEFIKIGELIEKQDEL